MIGYQIMKRLPIGIHNFQELIDENYYYVDKTLLIKELLEAPGKVVLIPRARRFGKTLNLSMLQYFFEKSTIDHSYLVHDKLVWQYPEIQGFSGQYPVIFLTFNKLEQEFSHLL